MRAVPTRVVALVATAAAVLAPEAAAVVETTEPQPIIVEHVRLLDHHLRLPRAKIRRGSIVTFRVRNDSHRRRTFRIGRARTRVIAPGHVIRLVMYFDFRGKYRCVSLPRGRGARLTRTLVVV